MLLDVEGRKIKPGMRVVLVSDMYKDGLSNPRVGTEWECEGVFEGATNVRWDNGHGNTYSNHTLKLCDGCISIWDHY